MVESRHRYPEAARHLLHRDIRIAEKRDRGGLVLFVEDGRPPATKCTSTRITAAAAAMAADTHQAIL
jgi:hypothetical protein